MKRMTTRSVTHDTGGVAADTSMVDGLEGDDVAAGDENMDMQHAVPKAQQAPVGNTPMAQHATSGTAADKDVDETPTRTASGGRHRHPPGGGDGSTVAAG